MDKQISIFFITGTNGTGKSTLVHHLKSILPEHIEIHDFDEIGVPDNADQTWRIQTTKYWLQKAEHYAQDKKALVVCGVVVPSEAKLLQSTLQLYFGFIKLDDKLIEQRLITRGWSKQLIQNNITWAHHLQQEVVQTKNHYSVDGSQSPEVIAALFAQWIISILQK
ncbi:MAG: hypothetical protein AB7R69_02440 [Candidatus Babeliales bacterium]